MICDKELTPWGREGKDRIKKKRSKLNCNMLIEAAVHS